MAERSSVEAVQVHCSEKALEATVTSTRRLTKVAGLALFVVVFLFSFFGWPSKVINDANVHSQSLAKGLERLRKATKVRLLKGFLKAS